MLQTTIRKCIETVRILLLGGHPKGFATPFSPETLSGKRLRGFVSGLHFQDVHFDDLWFDKLSEDGGRISSQMEAFLKCRVQEGFVILALGKRVQCALKNHTKLAFIALPHPATRRRTDLNKLKKGLKELSGV